MDRIGAIRREGRGTGGSFPTFTDYKERTR